jgi:hypothetical protein
MAEAQQFIDEIKKTIGTGKKKEIPKPKLYKIPTINNGVGILQVDKKDLVNFQKLYPKHLGNATIGKGEEALFWLFGGHLKGTANKAGHGGGGGADLSFYKIPAEVKSYPKIDQMTLGKFKEDRDSIEIFSFLFGFYNMFMQFGNHKKVNNKTVLAYKTLLTFTVEDVVEALAYYDVLKVIFTDKKIQRKIANLRAHGHVSQGSTMTQAKQAVAKKEKVINGFNNNVKKYATIVGLTAPAIKTAKPADREILASFLVRAFLSTKLSKKPGDGGFMVNVPTTAMKSGWDGKIYFHKIVLKNVAKKYNDLKTGFAVGSGEIQIKDTKILH